MSNFIFGIEKNFSVTLYLITEIEIELELLELLPNNLIMERGYHNYFQTFAHSGVRETARPRQKKTFKRFCFLGLDQQHQWKKERNFAQFQQMLIFRWNQIYFSCLTFNKCSLEPNCSNGYFILWIQSSQQFLAFSWP